MIHTAMMNGTVTRGKLGWTIGSRARDFPTLSESVGLTVEELSGISRFGSIFFKFDLIDYSEISKSKNIQNYPL